MPWRSDEEQQKKKLFSVALHHYAMALSFYVKYLLCCGYVILEFIFRIFLLYDVKITYNGELDQLSLLFHRFHGTNSISMDKICTFHIYMHIAKRLNQLLFRHLVHFGKN